MDTFSCRLKELRKVKGLTQKQLAESLYIDHSSISKYETNKAIPENELLQKIADFFQVSTDYLLGRSNNKNLENLFSGTGALSKAFESFKQSSTIELMDNFSVIISKLLLEEGLYTKDMSYEEKVILAEKVVSVLKIIQNK